MSALEMPDAGGTDVTSAASVGPRREDPALAPRGGTAQFLDKLILHAGRWALVVDALGLVLFAVLLRLPSLSLSVFASADESAFILAGHEVILGNLPYLTFWDHKPLGSTMMIGATMAVFGATVEAVRALGMACVIATAWLLYLIVQRLASGRLVALSAALLYIAYSTRLSGIATITEILLAPFTVAGILLLLTVPLRQSRGALLLTFGLAGLAFGMAT
jgi:hypothetical protein